jgi:hypothetical protein
VNPWSGSCLSGSNSLYSYSGVSLLVNSVNCCGDNSLDVNSVNCYSCNALSGSISLNSYAVNDLEVNLTLLILLEPNPLL